MISINNYGFHYLRFLVLKRCIEIQVSRTNEGVYSYYEINTLGLDGIE